jgi:hypothetical protein
LYNDFKEHFTAKFILSDEEYKTTCGVSGVTGLQKSTLSTEGAISPLWMWVDFALIGALVLLVVLTVKKFSQSKGDSNKTDIELQTALD